MKTLNKLLAHLLVISFLLPSLPVMAVVDVADDEEVSTPQNPPGMPVGIQCTELDQKPGLNGMCCVGLELNADGKCDEPVYNDSALVSCTTDANCSGGTACLPQSVSDLFSPMSPNMADKDELTEAKNSLRAQLNEVEAPQEVGGSCTHARDCFSYSCVNRVCKEKLVCRYGGIGEVVGANVKCGGDLVKDATGKCDQSPESKNPVYIGLLDEAVINLTNKPNEMQCSFEVDEETKKSSLAAMKSLRAMEWFFSTVSLDPSEECFGVMPVLKNEIGGSFLTTRKTILENFSKVYSTIEADYKTLIDAKAADPKTTVSIHNGEKITNQDLTTRQTSGFDNLMMLFRRNLLFESYEKAMLQTIDTTNVRINDLATNMQGWKSNATSWNVGGKVVQAYNCEGSKYKVKKFLSWKTKYYNTVKDRWTNYYEVTGSAPANSDIVKRPGVAKPLGLMTGMKEEEVASEFTKSKYYLLDPLMFAGLKNGKYGDPKALKKKSSFLGLFGGFKDLRKAYYLRGDARGSLTQMYNDLRPGLENFYRGLKPSNMGKGFIYEPELLTTEAKDCLENPEKPEGCSGFPSFLTEVQDETFAHFLAYSFHNQDSYEGFFEDARSYRRKLLAKLHVDMQNISKYYQKVIEIRQKQNACIDALQKRLTADEILADTTNVNNGVIEGPTAEEVGKGTINPLGTGVKPPTTKISTRPKFDRTRFSYDLASTLMKDISANTIRDAIGSDKGGASGGLSSASASMFALRADALDRANKKAKAAGVNLEKKEKAVKEILRSMKGPSQGSFGAGSLASGSRSSSFGLDSLGEAKLGPDRSKGEMDAASSEKSSSDAGATSNSLVNINPLSGVGQGYGTQSATSESESTSKDLTGLSDSDKDRLMSEYEKNKSEYEGAEDDGIFQKVSKAYVRNLDKVLTKKKKID